MFGQVMGSILSSAKEKFVDHGLGILLGNFKSRPGSEDLERSFKSLTARADDLKNDISTQQQGGGKRKREEVTVWFREVKRAKREYLAFRKEEKMKGFVKRMFGGDGANQLNDRLRELVDRSRQFGELVGDDTTCGGVARPTSKLEGKAFEDNFKRIWNSLEKDQVCSIGVHGMGGVGKSTLVDHINNQLLQRHECVFWVVVSQGCTIQALQDKIARKLGVVLSDEDDMGARAGRLCHTLSQRGKFLLILDDVWEHIDLLKVGVPLSLQGCKWMMTSRSLKVCQEMNCQEKIEVKPLSRDEGWNLFLKNLGTDATLALEDHEVEEIVESAVGICGGLPLGIVTLAGAMSGVTDIQEWRHAFRVLKESALGHEWMEENVFKVLKYSFDRLNPKDQRCFLYCSLYPEDYIIPREELLCRFMSEDLVDTTKSVAAQRDEGHSILTRLVKVALLESVSAHFLWGDGVKMHDLVRAMALKITHGSFMTITCPKGILIEEEWTVDLEKVSLMMNSIEVIPQEISPNCPKLSTLRVWWNPLSKGITASFFSRMCGLCTLDLSSTQIEELPNFVSDLVSLKSLLLGRCYKLRHVPSLRKVTALRELDLTSCPALEKVPQGLEELINLKFLSINEVYHASFNTVSNLELKSPCLQLLRLHYGIQVKLVEAGWKSLEVFEGRLQDMSDFNRLVANKKDGLTYTIMVSYNSNIVIYSTDKKIGYGNTRLSVSNYRLEDVGGSEFTIPAECIQHIEFTFCQGLGKCLLDKLSNPSSLKNLKIGYSKEVECMVTYQQLKAPPPYTKSRFEALEEIELTSLEDFTGVINNREVEAAATASVFPSLRKLTIDHCEKLKKVGLPLSVFQKLEYISIHECGNLEEIMQVGEADGDGVFICLPSLTYLSLVRLPTLESLCDAPLICDSINAFEIKECPRLEDPSFYRGTPDSYKPLFAQLTLPNSRTHKKWWH